ncbi:MAG: glycogen/starch synthase, partial [Thiogranum sp.]
MDVLFCTSEAFPLIKTGGLGDVCGSLPGALHELGNDVRLILPAYPEVMERAGKLNAVASLTLAGASEPVEILHGQLPGSEVGLYLV